jgi:hypothetical protein
MRKKSLTQRFEIIKPWLEKDDWAAMTYMLIPSVLKEAEALRIDLVSAPGNETAAERRRMLRALRKIMTDRAERVRQKKAQTKR